jgi:hypothetical protein
MVDFIKFVPVKALLSGVTSLKCCTGVIWYITNKYFTWWNLNLTLTTRIILRVCLTCVILHFFFDGNITHVKTIKSSNFSLKTIIIYSKFIYLIRSAQVSIQIYYFNLRKFGHDRKILILISHVIVLITYSKLTHYKIRKTIMNL